MPITYRELGALIHQMSDKDRDRTATLYVPSEDQYHDAVVAYTADDCVWLAPEYPIITIA